MNRKQVEVRYMRLRSARSFRVWAAHAAVGDTPAVGPMIVLRLLGWSVVLYPWMFSKGNK